MVHLQPRVVIIIPNYNLKFDLDECLESLTDTDYPEFDVIVVDNGSSDGSIDLIQKKQPWVKIIAQKNNYGYASALNAGIVFSWKSNPKYYLFLNNDTLVPSDTVKKLVTAMEQDSKIAIAAPKIIYHEQPNKIFSLGDKVYPWLPLPVRFGKQKLDKPKYNRTLEFDYVFGCALLVRASVLEKIGLFDTSYFMFYEDADFCRRVRQVDLKIVRVGSAIIRHKSSRRVKKDPRRMIFLRARNRSRFYRKYRHGPHPLFTWMALLLGSIMTVIRFLLSRNFGSIYPYIHGVWIGLIEKLPEPVGINDLKEKNGYLLG